MGYSRKKQIGRGGGGGGLGHTILNPLFWNSPIHKTKTNK